MAWRRDVVNVQIYNVEQRRINVLYFKVDLNNVRQRQNNVVIFNVDFHNVGNVETTLQIWPFEKNISPDSKTK